MAAVYAELAIVGSDCPHLILGGHRREGAWPPPAESTSLPLGAPELNDRWLPVAVPRLPA